jgi:hypothetical protein
MAMAAAMVLMVRRSGSYGCAIKNGEKLETEFIEIPMVDLLQGAAENHVCLFGGLAWTMCCACATTAVAGMMMTNAVTSTVATVMVIAKVGMMMTLAMALVTVAMTARMTVVTVVVHLRL